MNDPHGLISLNAWSQGSGTILKYLGGFGPFGGSMSPGVSFKVSNVRSNSSPLSGRRSGYSSQLHSLAPFLPMCHHA